MAGITDVRAYSALGTDSNPLFVVRTSDNHVLVYDSTLDSLTDVLTLDGSSQGACLIPFRPNQSPQSWMYIAAAEDYQKISAGGSIATAVVGVEEPHLPPQAVPAGSALDFISDFYTAWANSGVAGSPSNSDQHDTILAAKQDPVSLANTSPLTANRWSLQIGDDKYYQVGTPIFLDDYASILCQILDVVPPINQGATLPINDIYYYSGSTGRCVIVPQQSPITPTIPSGSGEPISDSIFATQTMAALRRGALMELENAAYQHEVVLVLDVIKGPDGSTAFECVTTHTYAAADSLTGLPAIVVDHFAITSAIVGNPVIRRSLDIALTGAGTGYLDQSPFQNGYNPFTHAFGGLDATAQQDDYITFGVMISDVTLLTAGRLILNVGATVDYTTDAYYIDIDPSTILQYNPALSSAFSHPTFNDYLVTQGYSQEVFNSFSAKDSRRQQLQDAYNAIYGAPTSDALSPLYPSNQWTIISFPIRALTRLGANQNRTLSNCNAARWQWDVTAAVDISVTMITVNGGGQPDVGQVGSPYFYAYTLRSSVTGVRSNPSQQSRYGVAPRRQPVIVEVEPDQTDPQVDWIDIYRWGGTITSWRYIGSMPNTGSTTLTFVDNNSDAAVTGGPLIEYDNFQPWPSIDLPFDLNGVLGTGLVTGTAVRITFVSSGAVPPNILRWLPGTLLVMNNMSYTLWVRPTLISGLTYLIQLVECANFGTVFSLRIFEPVVASQNLPYVWGPDAAGTVFAVGDPLRPGFISFAKSNNPDSVPDKFNLEITAPSEPLLGGVIIDGLCMVASSFRWWALYPNFGGTPRYQKVQRAIPRGLSAPYGICTDGKLIYFWATDGIWVATDSSATSLTDGPLRNLFHHEGINGHDVTYAGYTIYAPDYKYVSEFRLSYCNGFLYADYVDSTATRRTLVCDTMKKVPAWIIDHYADPITCHYQIESPQDTLLSASMSYPILVMGDANGNLFRQQPYTNDAGVPISGAIATFEFDGGDIRSDQLWGDAFLDSNPESGLSVTPVSDRDASGVATVIPASASRTRSVIKASGIEKKTLGILVEWTDDFDYLLYGVNNPTRLYAWQPLHQAIPISIYQWKTQGTNFGLQGYVSMRQLVAAYRSTATVTIHIDAYDGTAPADITLPATGDAYQKVAFPFTFNKALLFFFTCTSTAPWRPYFDAWEVYVGPWGRSSPFLIFADIERPRGIANSIPGPQPHILGGGQ